MLAATYDIRIEQGTTWDFSATWKNDDDTPVDLTGWSARMQVRAGVAEPVALEITDAVVDGPEGTISLSATAEQTAAIPIDQDRLTWDGPKPAQVMFYDMELFTDSGVVRRFLQGSAIIYPEITR